MGETLTEIQAFMAKEVIDPKVALTASTRLMEEGLIDSLSIVVLLNFISSRFGVEVPLDELTEENLQSLEAIAALVERLRPVNPAA
jgi:acyl carrier protein